MRTCGCSCWIQVLFPPDGSSLQGLQCIERTATELAANRRTGWHVHKKLTLTCTGDPGSALFLIQKEMPSTLVNGSKSGMPAPASSVFQGRHVCSRSNSFSAHSDQANPGQRLKHLTFMCVAPVPEHTTRTHLKEHQQV